MIKNAKYIIPTILVLCIFSIPFTISSSSLSSRNPFQTFKTIEDILEKRKRYFTPASIFVPDRIFKVLIVPGHDDEYSGAVYGGVEEVELNRLVAQKLFEYLNKEPGMQPILAHEENRYNPFLEFYFSKYKNDIESFMEKSKRDFTKKLKKEDAELEDSGFHNAAMPDARFRLYGINWWSNQNQIDLVIHIHFNDYADRKGKEKKYNGFSIYTPGEFFGNYKLSNAVAYSIFDELKKIRPISNLPYEEEGVIEGHELIAVGSNESLYAGSVLIEYGYIYEDIFQDEEKRDVAFDYLAYSTYVGIKNFLDEESFKKETAQLSVQKNKTTENNLIWQFEKALEGVYPPKGKTLRECPITGYFGECSKLVK